MCSCSKGVRAAMFIVKGLKGNESWLQQIKLGAH